MTYDEILSDPCPHCGKVGFIHLMQRDESVKVRGQAFAVSAEFFHCNSCETDFEAVDGPDVLDAAYRQYRDANGLVQPERLKEWRQSLGLKQAELALVLGWSTATVSRYENGALQDDAHDKAMRAAMTPDGLAELVRTAKGLSSDTNSKLQKLASQSLGSADQLAAVVASRISQSTSQALNWRKVSETVIYLCQGRGVSRTKLNKLLFYTDFLHIKHFGLPVTGLPYVRLPHGPVPNDYELIFTALHAKGVIDIMETEFGENVAYMHCARRGPDITVFSGTELQALAKVQTEFERVGANDISERSHKEDAWLKTPAGARVSLVHAKALSLSL